MGEAEKPLFIPLARKWFDKFLMGEKNTEYRAYGPRWNERTCRIGRLAVLSMGYGKKYRMTRTVSAFHKLPRARAPLEAQEIFPKAEYIAAIKVLP